jgi:hypothetical protein
MRRQAPKIKTLPNVFFCGGHGTGKSSRVRWVSERYGLPMIQEVATSELHRLGTTIEALRANVAAVSRYQRGVWARQLATEKATPSPFVSDRGPDNLAYLALHGDGVADIIESREFIAAMAALRRSVVFLVRPHNGIIPADGIRPAADTLRDSQMRIDGAVTLLLKAWRVNPVPLSGEPADQELVIASVLEAHGFRPVV